MNIPSSNSNVIPIYWYKYPTFCFLVELFLCTNMQKGLYVWTPVTDIQNLLGFRYKQWTISFVFFIFTNKFMLWNLNAYFAFCLSSLTHFFVIAYVVGPFLVHMCLTHFNTERQYPRNDPKSHYGISGDKDLKNVLKLIQQTKFESQNLQYL